jgi:hypothetical protein
MVSTEQEVTMHKQSDIAAIISEQVEAYLDGERMSVAQPVTRDYLPDNMEAWARKLSVVAAFLMEREGLLLTWYKSNARMFVTVSR